MTLLDTERLVLRELCVDDAGFMLELLNEPGWRRFIGDRGVRTLEAARQDIVDGPMAMYRRHGFGLHAVRRKSGGEPIGICGLLKREALDDVDIGFAFLERHGGRGYAHESAAAMIRHGREVLGLQRIVAITTSDNEASVRLLQRLGLRFERMVTLPGKDQPLQLFGTPRPPP
jgi:ribosomal-protein-alanine N-acetyltransferase